MEIKVGDILKMKKQHPCGQHDFIVLRVGADLLLRCCGCGREIMVNRNKLEKNIKIAR